MKRCVYLLGFVLLLAYGCKKNDYYKDSGTTNPNYSGTVLDYLHSQPGQFDSISKIIHLAGMDDVFRNQTITFFASSDSSVHLAMQTLNDQLAMLGMQPIDRLEQIDSSVWRKYVSLYLFNGAKSLNDYPQVDWSNFSAFSGQSYASYGGYLMNIGVVFNDAGGIQYAGYRQLQLSYIGSQTSPKDITLWLTLPVVSANIHPSNGYVHALSYLYSRTTTSGGTATMIEILIPFSFNPYQLALDAIKAGIKY
ncbi:MULTISPECIES: hypothetical protein [Chitinophagaceae]